MRGIKAIILHTFGVQVEVKTWNWPPTTERISGVVPSVMGLSSSLKLDVNNPDPPKDPKNGTPLQSPSFPDAVIPFFGSFGGLGTWVGNWGAVKF